MEYTFIPNTLIEITSLAKEINPEIYDGYYKVYIRLNRFDFVIIVILKDMNRHLNIEKGKYFIQKESFDYEPYLQLDSIYLFQSLQKFVERTLKIRKPKFWGFWETNSFEGVEELLTGEIDGNIIIKETENVNYKQNKYIDITSLAKKTKPSIFKNFEKVYIYLNYTTYYFYGIQKNDNGTFSIVRETLDYPKNQNIRAFTLDNDCIVNFIKNSDKGRFYIFSECELDFIEEAIDYITKGEDTIPDSCLKQSLF